MICQIFITNEIFQLSLCGLIHNKFHLFLCRLRDRHINHYLRNGISSFSHMISRFEILNYTFNNVQLMKIIIFEDYIWIIFTLNECIFGFIECSLKIIINKKILYTTKKIFLILLYLINSYSLILLYFFNFDIIGMIFMKFLYFRCILSSYLDILFYLNS